MYSIALATTALLGAFLPTALAQTFTECNPLNTTGCPNMQALGANHTFQFNATINNRIWEQKSQGEVKKGMNGTMFTIKRRKDSPELRSAFYIFFGRLEVVMRASDGQGIISSAIMQSECLDEIDWEFKGGNTTHVMTNYFGKGNRTDLTRGIDYPMDSSPQSDFHNYTIDWTKERIQWWLDDKMLRELKYADAWEGKNYPQTPMNIRIGSWSAGDKENNPKDTVDWAGGETNFDDGPFTFQVKTVYVKDYTEAKEYSWEDMDASGSYEKVKIIEPGVKSDALKEIEKPHGIKNRWAALSNGAKIGIIAGIAGSVVLLLAFIAICCIKQRRAGRKEYAVFQAEENKHAAELAQHKQQWQSSHRASRYRRI